MFHVKHKVVSQAYFDNSPKFRASRSASRFVAAFKILPMFYAKHFSSERTIKKQPQDRAAFGCMFHVKHDGGVQTSKKARGAERIQANQGCT